MKLFYTKNVEHLAKKIKIKKGKFEIKKFADGELYVKINEDVKNKQVWVLSSTNPPAENILELMFLLDALKRSGAKINLFLTYFGYARQDRADKAEAFTSKRICSWLKDYGLKKILVLHMHSQRLKDFLKYKSIIPEEIFYRLIKRDDVLVAPDKGAAYFVKKLGKICGCSIAVIEKSRTKEKVEAIKLAGDVKGKKAIIVDDMISTGGTIISAGRLLKEKGAKEISVISTHGVFCGDAVDDLQRSIIKKVYVTDSLPQKKHPSKIKVIVISKLIERLLKS